MRVLPVTDFRAIATKRAESCKAEAAKLRVLADNEMKLLATARANRESAEQVTACEQLAKLTTLRARQLELMAEDLGSTATGGRPML
jgi:DNA-directed RNA polymerase subunit K/omega